MRFQKRIQILPWVHLNISATGVSLSLGPPGLSINIGKKGTKLTAGIPGTGLSSTHQLSVAPRPENFDELSIEENHPGIDFSLLPPPPEDDDPLYRDAVSVVVFSRRASATALTRKLAIGYNRATNMIDRMESDGIVTPLSKQGSREVVWLGMSPLESRQPKIDVEALLRECRFAEWLENYLEPLSVNASPLYARAVAATLIYDRFGAEFLVHHLEVPEHLAETMTELMAFDGVIASTDNPSIPESRMDFNALWKSFELHDAARNRLPD